jgi:hypothetical protein
MKSPCNKMPITSYTWSIIYQKIQENRTIIKHENKWFWDLEAHFICKVEYTSTTKVEEAIVKWNLS